MEVKLNLKLIQELIKFFVANADNDPLMSGSTFNENRMQVIKKNQ